MIKPAVVLKYSFYPVDELRYVIVVIFSYWIPAMRKATLTPIIPITNSEALCLSNWLQKEEELILFKFI